MGRVESGGHVSDVIAKAARKVQSQCQTRVQAGGEFELTLDELVLGVLQLRQFDVGRNVQRGRVQTASPFVLNILHSKSVFVIK